MTTAYRDSAVTLHNARISPEDAARQERTACVLLERLAHQPGVILADEVGMGKTFVALAVAVSTILNRPHAGPVVVMVPSSLKTKWPRDWNVFSALCLKCDEAKAIRATSADTGVELLRLLDDPPERRHQLIFLAHGALNRALQDHWVRLALIRRAFKGRSSLRGQRDNFHKFAGKLMREESRLESKAPGILGKLLERRSETWLKTLHQAHPTFVEVFKDDPVPLAVQQVLDDIDSRELGPLVEALARLPVRWSVNIDRRIQNVRQELTREMRALWARVLARTQFSSPLLILDEAHHLRNPQTKFASLFIDDEANADSEAVTGGPLAGKFDRMLFLTATPFQLGHAELVRVLERFQGIRWVSDVPPSIARETFMATLAELGEALDEAQISALRLERAWGRLESTHLTSVDGRLLSVDEWWGSLKTSSSEPLVPAVAEVLRHVDVTTKAMRAAEVSVGPWVVRNVKARHLPGLPSVPRRLQLPGALILEGGTPNAGLPVSGDALLPFLLAGRAQILLARSEKGRAWFADGLASSFEAYRETRRGTARVDEDEAPATASEISSALGWYLRHLDRALPPDSTEAYRAHPKIAATVERVARLWLAGEKVLVFCHYRATGRALRRHISQRLQAEIECLGHKALPDLPAGQVADQLARVGDDFFREDRPLRRQVDEVLTSLVSEALAEAKAEAEGRSLSNEEVNKVVDVIRRFLRTPSFLVRYFPMAEAHKPGVFVRALARTDDSGVTLRAKLVSFCQFLADRVPEERAEYLDALDTIQTGSGTERLDEIFDAAERDDGRQPIRLPNVRLANGESRDDTRRRLLLGFNTPLFPEVLIASSVLAEGVDLHLNCRYVVHHDLCWNPSTLEQRSGRVDRIGSKAEQVQDSIHLYLPYVAATRDEKMFRVVRDRERWFQIVLGEKYRTDELALDRAAERIELPEALRSQLALKLH